MADFSNMHIGKNLGDDCYPGCPQWTAHKKSTSTHHTTIMSLSTNSTAIIRRDDRPTDAVMETMRLLVSDGTKATYTQEHLKFIAYLYDLDADEFISDWVLDEFHKAHDKDQEQARTKRNRRHLRECIRRHLHSMNRFDKNCPIVLAKVTYTLFSGYMLDVRSTDESGILSYMSASTYGTMKSALVYLFNASGQTMERSLCKELDIFIRSLKKNIAKVKASSGESLEEGKKPMSFAVYKLMCKKLMESKTSDALFAHAFLVLEWNLMARAHMVGDMDVSHIEWRQDCLLLFFGISKRNQSGEDSERPFHVYSNPENPEICPVLALAAYLAAYPDVLQSSGGLLFPGSSQYSRFMKIFHSTIDEHEDEFKKLGIAKGDLGVGSTLLGALRGNSLKDVFRHVRRTDGQSDHVRFVRVRSGDSTESDGTGNPESCPGKE